MSDDYGSTTESIRFAFALSRDGRDMQDYRYDRDGGFAAWDSIRDEAFAVFDAWLMEHDRQIAKEAWAEGHRDAMHNVTWPKERRSNPHAPSTALQGVQEKSTP